MRIRQIEIEGLFGLFHHVVPLNLEERVTILHGPNGVGKTTMLGLMSALRRADWAPLWRAPFSRLAVTVDDGRRLVVEKEVKAERPVPGHEWIGTLSLRVEQGEQQLRQGRLLVRYDADPERVQAALPELIPIGAALSFKDWAQFEHTLWTYRPTGAQMTGAEVLARFGSMMPIGFGWDKFLPFDVMSGILPDICFVQTQRLLVLDQVLAAGEAGRGGRPRPLPAIIKAAGQMAARVHARLAAYGELAQSLDSSFPARLLKRDVPPAGDSADLQRRLRLLQENRARLQDAGLLEPEHDSSVAIPPSIDPVKASALAVYVEDTEKKLAVLEELAGRIEVLQRVINERFLYKQIRVDRMTGFVVLGADGKTLPIEVLSSGEQHALVLLNTLLFDLDPDTLVLIDEPEISFHVDWQERFIPDIQEIAKLAGFDVLVATHSPQIIHDRRDLTVALRGPGS